MEYEQECMVNRLQRQIQAIHREKTLAYCFEFILGSSEIVCVMIPQVLLRTIQQSIDLLQMARSASATPALE